MRSWWCIGIIALLGNGIVEAQELSVSFESGAVLVSSTTDLDGRLERSADMKEWETVLVHSRQAGFEYREPVAAASASRFFRFMAATTADFSSLVLYESIPNVLAYDDEEFVRNGDFRYQTAGWNRQASESLFGIQITEAADRSGDQRGLEMIVIGDLGSGVPGVSQVLQPISLPDRISRLSFSSECRMLGNLGGFGIGAFAFQLVLQDTAGEFTHAMPLTRWSNDGSVPVNDLWDNPSIAIEGESLGPFLEGQAAGGTVMLMARLEGWSIRALIDLVSLRITGERDLPQIGDGIVYSQPVGLNEWALRVVRLDGGEDRLLHQFSSTFPPGRPAWVEAEGEAGSIEGISFSQGSLYSRFNQDIVWFDGTKLARISNPPTYEAILSDGRPTGRVLVSVENVSLDQTLTASVWVEGAKSPLAFTSPLGPGEQETVTLGEVIDLGLGDLQYVTVRDSATGNIENVVTTVDVIAGQDVLVNASISGTSRASFRATHHSWLADRSGVVSSLGGVLTRFGRAGDVGEVLNVFGSSPVVSPMDNRMVISSGIGLILLNLDQDLESVSEPRTLTETGWSPVWFSDGQRLLYVDGVLSGDLAVYDLATGTSSPLTVMADFFEEDLSAPTLSRDEQWMLAERTLRTEGSIAPTEIWIYSVKNPSVNWRLPLGAEARQPLWGR